MSDDKQAYRVQIIEPRVGNVRVRDGMIDVTVRATGPTKPIVVRAEAYRGNPPGEPATKLDSQETKGIFSGKIPGFLGDFRLKVEAQFDADPSVKANVDAGPFVGVKAWLANECDIRCPLPAGGNVVLGMNDDFRVRVLADGTDTVDEVFAQCFNGTVPIGSEETLDRIGSSNIYTKLIQGRIGTFRIKAKATFKDSMGMPVNPPQYDNDGDYTGHASSGQPECPST